MIVYKSYKFKRINCVCLNVWIALKTELKFRSMGECSTCPKERKVTVKRPYRSVPRNVRFSSQLEPTVTENFRYPQRNRFSPNECDSCNIDTAWESYRPYFDSIYSPSCADSLRCPCPTSPCQETQCYYCPESNDYGIFSSIRNGFQKIFNGNRKPNCEPIRKGKVYNYTASQLKTMEQYLCKLEDEASCVEEVIKEAFDCDYQIRCNRLRCILTSICERLEVLKCDLTCAYECYDPCRDKFEFELISALMERSNCLEALVNDLSLQLECLEYKLSCESNPCEISCCKPCCDKRPACKPNCTKPCCCRPNSCTMSNDLFNCGIVCGKPCCVYKPKCTKPCCYRRNSYALPYNPLRQPCEIDCQKPCCYRVQACDRPRRRRNGNCNKINGLCRTSSVIPLGVMLVKL